MFLNFDVNELFAEHFVEIGNAVLADDEVGGVEHIVGVGVRSSHHFCTLQVAAGEVNIGIAAVDEGQSLGILEVETLEDIDEGLGLGSVEREVLDHRHLVLSHLVAESRTTGQTFHLDVQIYFITTSRDYYCTKLHKNYQQRLVKTAKTTAVLRYFFNCFTVFLQ